jgi:hypothetical protein
MMVMKKDGEAVSQQRIVGHSGLKESFLHIARQVGPKSERCVTQQQLKLPGQITHLPPLAHDRSDLLPDASFAVEAKQAFHRRLSSFRTIDPN